jgi:hypothetical protein
LEPPRTSASLCELMTDNMPTTWFSGILVARGRGLGGPRGPRRAAGQDRVVDELGGMRGFEVLKNRAFHIGLRSLANKRELPGLQGIEGALSLEVPVSRSEPSTRLNARKALSQEVH